MTDQKQLKTKIRARMAKTGERYTTARAHVLGTTTTAGQPFSDGGYLLRGGVQPDSSSLTNVLAHRGVHRADGRPLGEPLLFGIAGGIGAGYILWEFKAYDAPNLVLGFRSRWQYPEAWLTDTLGRLGVPFDVHTTSGAKGAAARLDAELAEGRPVIVLPDRYLLGYWHLPPHLEAFGGHFVVAYAESGGRVRLDDRNLAPLTVERAAFDRARARVVSYKNLLVVPTPAAGPVADSALAAVVESGLRDCVERLSATSDSFSLPAWRKWARMMTDQRNAKAWPKVFADRRGLVGALLSIWENVEPAGMTGGNLRGLFADFLDEAAAMLGRPALTEQAGAWREIAGLWHDLADVALAPARKEFARARDLTAAVQESIVASGDAGQEVAAKAAEELWRLRADVEADCPLDADETASLFADLGERLQALFGREKEAIAALDGILR